MVAKKLEWYQFLSATCMICHQLNSSHYSNSAQVWHTVKGTRIFNTELSSRHHEIFLAIVFKNKSIKIQTFRHGGNDLTSKKTRPCHGRKRMKLKNNMLIILRSLTSSFSRMSASRGLDMLHWFRQSSNIIIFNTADSIWRTNKNIKITFILNYFFIKINSLLKLRWCHSN